MPRVYADQYDQEEAYFSYYDEAEMEQTKLYYTIESELDFDDYYEESYAPRGRSFRPKPSTKWTTTPRPNEPSNRPPTPPPAPPRPAPSSRYEEKRRASSPPPRPKPQSSRRRRDPSPTAVQETSDLYEILGIERSATAIEIKIAYRKMSLVFHPDRVGEGDKEKATEIMAQINMAQINMANEVLSDRVKRVHYDFTGEILSK